MSGIEAFRSHEGSLEDLERVTFEYAERAGRLPPAASFVAAAVLFAASVVGWKSLLAARLVGLLSLPAFLGVVGVARWLRRHEPAVATASCRGEALRRGGYLVAALAAWALLALFWAGWPREVGDAAAWVVTLGVVALVAAAAAAPTVLRAGDAGGVAALLALGTAWVELDTWGDPVAREVSAELQRKVTWLWLALAVALVAYGLQQRAARRDLAQRMERLRARLGAPASAEERQREREALARERAELGRAGTELAEWAVLPWMVLSLGVGMVDLAWGGLLFAAGPLLMLALVLVDQRRQGNAGVYFEAPEPALFPRSPKLVVASGYVNGLVSIAAVAFLPQFGGTAKGVVAAALALLMLAAIPVAWGRVRPGVEEAVVYGPWFLLWGFARPFSPRDAYGLGLGALIAASGLAALVSAARTWARRRALTRRIAELGGEAA